MIRPIGYPKPCTPLKPISFKGVTIKADENKQCQFLYNKLLDIVREEKTGAVFRPYDVTIPSEKPSLIEKLVKLGINFIKEGKK